MKNLFKKNKKQKRIRQSDKHNLIRSFLFEKTNIQRQTQSQKRAAENSIKTIVIDEIAYWIKDNVFYMAEMNNNIPDQNKTRPVDIDSMPKKELDKMLFILDNLRRGDLDDSSGTRH